MRVPYFLALLIVALQGPVIAHAADASVQSSQGNIFFADGLGGGKQLTSSGADASPRLSPDGRTVVYVRGVAGKPPELATELWLADVDTGKVKELLAPREAADPEQRLVGLKAPSFSTDGKWVYFLSSAWTVSDAMHAIAVDGTKRRFVTPANSLDIVGWGEYKGHAVVQKHKYFLGGGSYDWYWLVSPEGKEVGPVGPDADTARRFLESPPR